MNREHSVAEKGEEKSKENIEKPTKTFIKRLQIMTKKQIKKKKRIPA